MSIKPEIIEKIKEMLEQGKRRKEIMYACKVSNTTMVKYFPHIKHDDVKRQLKGKDLSHLNSDEVAKMYRISRDYVLKLTEEVGLKIKKRPRGGYRGKKA